MKVTAYVRVGHDRKAPNVRARKVRVSASARPSDEPLYNSDNHAIPTVHFALDLELPDAMFTRAEDVIATLTVPKDQVEIAASVKRTPRKRR